MVSRPAVPDRYKRFTDHYIRNRPDEELTAQYDKELAEYLAEQEKQKFINKFSDEPIFLARILKSLAPDVVRVLDRRKDDNGDSE